MVTFAQAQERAEEWINGDVPAYLHREVRVREFELGFVVWAEDRDGGPRSDGGAQRLVIARDSGEATLWPGLPVGEVIRRYEEEYGARDAEASAVPAPAARVDLNQTSFLLTPPEWLQEAADRRGVPERRTSGDGVSDGAGSRPAAAVSPGASGTAWPAAGGGEEVPGASAGDTPWAGTDTNAEVGEDRSVPLPETVFAPPLSDSDEGAVPLDEKAASVPGGTPQGAPQVPGAPGAPGAAHAPGAPGAAAYGYPQPPGGVPGAPQAPGAASYGYPQAPGTPAPGAPASGAPAPGVPQAPAPNAADIADAATSKAVPPRVARAGGPPHPPGAPGVPGARPGVTPPPPPPPPSAPGASAGGYVPTQLVSQLGPGGPEGAAGPGMPPPPGGPQSPGVPNPPGAPSAPAAPTPPGPPPGGVHHAATMLADPNRPGPGAPDTPNPPGPPSPSALPAAPGQPGAPGQPAASGQPGVPGAPNPSGASRAPGAPGAVHHAETMLAGPPAGGPGAAAPPPPPPPPGAPGMPPGAPQPPGQPVPGQPMGGPAPGQPVPGQPVPGQPVPGQPAPGQPVPGQQPPGQPVPGAQPSYGYPPQGPPTVGPGYQAVLRYRAQDGSEQQLIRRSAPGMPHPEWQIFHELRAMNVPPGQVLELHTELESCELPGAYCARMIRENWPQARITSIAPYGTDHASRQQGMRQLLAHQGELHQVADGPARPGPVRAPLPAVQPAPPVPPEGIAQELAGSFGPGIFRFEQAAVSRQGVPPIVAHTLVVAGLPFDMGPFFWAQAQPGRPVPTLAELAQERGVQPAPDAGSYLVMGSDFGKAICVQYGTANIVAVPVEAGPGGASVPPQFVNTGLPEFVRALALLGRMWRLRYGLNQEQAGRWTVDFQAQLASLDPAALSSPESWWSVLLEQMWDGLL
ncbi:SUKH-4 family immunity protein [Streptomyces sp. NPDC058960]|uniref:SUKH-4 family immunity protein n=1 Tax=Streptomyces sp. NPDC058960 TaxID=3346679 RepID=UPI0036929D98